MSNRSFNLRNFFGGLLGGVLGILAFGSFGFWPGLAALLVGTTLGFLLGFHLRELPAHAVASCRAALSLCESRTSSIREGTKRRWDALVRIRVVLWSGLVVAILVVGLATLLPTITDDSPFLIQLVLLTVVLIAASLISMTHEFLHEVGDGHTDELYRVMGGWMRKVLRTLFIKVPNALRNDPAVRVPTGLTVGLGLHLLLHLSAFLMVAYWYTDSMFLLLSTFTLLAFDFAVCLSWVNNGPPSWRFEEVKDTTADEIHARLEQWYKARFDRRAAKLEQFGLPRFILFVMWRMWVIQFAFMMFLSVLPLFAGGSVVILVVVLPVMSLAVFLKTLPRLNTGRHWAGLAVTLATTLATAILTRDILVGQTLLAVALLNGVACGTLSIATIQVAHALPERWAWAARLKAQDVSHHFTAMFNRWNRFTQPLENRLTAPLERLRTLPDMGL